MPIDLPPLAAPRIPFDPQRRIRLIRRLDAMLVVAVLAIGGFGIAQKQLPGPTPTPTVSPTLLSFSIGDVTGLSIRTNDKETALVKDNNRWRLTKRL